MSPSSASFGGTPHAVEFGAAMRDMRLAHNADLATVAASLRIRQVYLQAIEDGRFDELPGPTYASGFVRAYAEYLGLDMGEVMRRYREVTRGGGAQTPLVAPSPVSEGRMPTGFVLLVAAVLAAAAYGSWYYLTLHDRDAGEIVASLPQRIADMVGLNLSSDKTAAPPPTAEPPSVAAPVPKMDAPVSPGPVVRKSAAPAESRAVTKPAPPVPAETAPPARIEPSPPSAQPTARESVAVAPPPAAVEPPPAQREAPAETGTASEAVAPAGEAAPPPSSANEPATAGRELAVPQPAVPTETPSPTPAPESAPEIATAPPAPAPAPAPESLASAPAGSSRVVLRATAISWVELRDADGRRVFSRLLKKGESFNVPPQPGITLATGNAGAIDILVDGQAVAPIGPVGAVRRDVLLEPDALLRAGAPVQ